MKRFLAFLTVLVLLPVSLSAAEKENAAITGPVAQTADERMKSFLYIVKAGEYQLQVIASGRDDSMGWVLTGDTWVYLGENDPLPEGTLFTFEEGNVYELSADGIL